MERRFLITSIFITLGTIAFVSGYLLTSPGGYRFQTGAFIERFDNNIEVNSVIDNFKNTTLVSNRKFVSFINPFTDSKKLIAVDNNSNVVEIDTFDLTEKILANLNKNSVSGVVLSPAGDSVVYSFYDRGGSKKHAYVNFKKNNTAEITGELKSAAFSPEGSQQTYLINKEGEGELLVAKGVNIIKRIIKTRLGNAMIDWPSEDFISMVSYDKDNYGDLFVLNKNGSLTKTVSRQRDLNVKWSLSGKKLVFSTRDGGDFDNLFYKNIGGSSQNVALDIEARAQKCVWTSEEEIICGITNQVQLKDEFYKINLAEKSKVLITTPSTNMLVKEVAISQSGEYLFILNSLDNKLYSLKLKP